MNPTYKQVTKARYIARVAELAQEIFPNVYRKLGGKNGLLLAETYQNEDLTEDEIRDGVNYFLIYLGSREVGYFALDLSPVGAMCISRLYLCEDVRGRGIGGRLIAAAATALAAEGLRVSLLCSPRRVHLYRRLGFVQAGALARCQPGETGKETNTTNDA